MWICSRITYISYNLETLVFKERGETGSRSKEEDQQQTQPTFDTLVNKASVFLFCFVLFWQSKSLGS